MARESILSILRRNGRTRFLKKKHMKYIDALNKLRSYQKGNLRLTDVVDNAWTPSKSISDKCQVEGCGKRIRYEYILRNVETEEMLIAGSTCVWAMLDLSKDEIKDFNKIERTIKDYHKSLKWRLDNPDVWEKVVELKKRGFRDFEPFWVEAERVDLTDEDTEYLRNLDLDTAGTVTLSGHSGHSTVSSLSKDEYKKVMEYLELLSDKYPDRRYIQYLWSISKNTVLSDQQVRSVKLEVQKDYYETKVKSNPPLLELYNKADDEFIPAFKKLVEERKVRVYSEDLKLLDTEPENLISKYRKQINDHMSSVVWGLYRIKNGVVL